MKFLHNLERSLSKGLGGWKEEPRDILDDWKNIIDRCLDLDPNTRAGLLKFVCLWGKVQSRNGKGTVREHELSCVSDCKSYSVGGNHSLMQPHIEKSSSGIVVHSRLFM